MKKLLFLATLLIAGTANAQIYQWAFNAGGTDADIGYSISTDIFGNVYITGRFQDTADFDPSGNTANLTANGNFDIFVAKYDVNGNYIWAFNVEATNGSNEGHGIATDVSGNVYVTGYFKDTADFDPSGNTANLTSNGINDFFVAKYDANGNYLWAFNVGGASGARGYDIATDPAGNGDVYLTGSFANTVDFDPSGNTANLTSNGMEDIFIAKYDVDGNYIWAFNMGELSDDGGVSIAIDPGGSGAAYLTGFFQDTADFDPSGNTASLISNGGLDFFVAKYDATGNYLWAFNVGGVSDDVGCGIAIDPTVSGDIYITGYFIGIVDFDPSGNTANLTPNGGASIFVAKYDANGNYLWAFNIGGTNGGIGRSITTDPAGSGDVYLTGYFQDTADFDPSGNIANLTSNGTADIFIAGYDASGNYRWAFSVGGTGNDRGQGIITNPAGGGDVYVTGWFEDTADFDPSGNTANLTSNGSAEVFIVKYSVPVGINEIHSSNSIVLFPNPTSSTFTISGNYKLPAVLKLYDITGRAVGSWQLAIDKEQLTIDVSSLSNGIYIWQIGSARGKLVLE